jgi:hypothetical protein
MLSRYVLALALVGLSSAVELVSVDQGDNGDNLRTIDSATGTEKLVKSLPGAAHPLAVFYDADNTETILATTDDISTVDSSGSVVSSVKQQDGLVVSIGYNRNTSSLFGIRELDGAISLVGIDRKASTIKTLVTANATGSVKAAYYAWKKNHYCVVVESRNRDEPDTMVFLDSKALAVHGENPVQKGLDIRALAINFELRNVNTIANVNGSMWLTITHMSGQLQQALVRLPDGVEVHHHSAAVVDNAANMFYGALSLHGKPKLFAFDLNQNGTMVSQDLAHDAASIALAYAQ